MDFVIDQLWFYGITNLLCICIPLIKTMYSVLNSFMDTKNDSLTSHAGKREKVRDLVGKEERDRKEKEV